MIVVLSSNCSYLYFYFSSMFSLLNETITIAFFGLHDWPDKNSSLVIVRTIENDPFLL